MQTFVCRSRIEAPAEEVFRWHARPGALERLTPPWETVKVLERTGGIGNGDRTVFVARAGPLRCRWEAEFRGYVEGRQFRDVQLSGPFAKWEHTHTIEPLDGESCVLQDLVEYALPMGRLGEAVAGAFVRRRLERLFAYRHRVTAADAALHHRRGGGAAMRILLSGSHGLIGSALTPFLTTAGHEVVALVRSTRQADSAEIHWDPDKGVIDASRLGGFDAVVHLAGENVAAGRWTPAKKSRIRRSRVQGTRLLSEALAQREDRPKVLVCASGIGFYGNRGEERLNENSDPGSGFLAETAQAAEAATDAAAHRGIRVVHLRFGMALSPAGGGLRVMLPWVKAGLGGRAGSGRQWVSWIAMDDAVGAIHHALIAPTLSGPVNAVAPGSLTNREFTRILGLVVGRPVLAPVPALAIRALYGEMANELILASARIEPARLLDSGYDFRYPELEEALRHLLGKGGERDPLGKGGQCMAFGESR